MACTVSLAYGNSGDSKAICRHGVEVVALISGACSKHLVILPNGVYSNC